MNRSRVLMCAAAILAAACQDRQPLPSAPSYLIQDAVHNGGNPHFYWLPPMTRQPTFTGTFDGNLSPTVEISELGGVTGCTDHVVATFTTTTGPGSETVRVDPTSQLYIVNWHTKAFNLNSACTYRIRFLVAGLPLGIADVDVVDNGAQLKRVDTDEFVGLLDDGTLAIKARVELGAVTFALTGDATACRPGRDCGEAVVTPVPGQDVTVLTTGQTAGLFIPAGALGEQVIVLIESRPATPDQPCIQRISMALPQFPDCYRFEVNPTSPPTGGLAPRQGTGGEIHNSYTFAKPVTVGMCVEVGGLSPAQQARLDLFRFDPVAGTVNVLPDAPARFLPCDPNFGVPLPPPVGAAGVLQRGWRVVMKGLQTLVGARTAYASSSVIHLGLGGSSCCTSYFTWGLPAALTANGPATFVVSPGSTVGPSVVVKDLGGSPIAGATVTFGVATGNGTIVGTTPVTTGADGIAQVSWQLPASGTGPFTLTASVPSAAGSPILFTAAAAVGVCPTGSVGTFATSTNFPDALAAAPPRGSIEVCSGTFAAESVVITKPVTIEAASGAVTTPVIQTNTRSIGFAIEGVASGTVAFRRLSFTGTGGGITSIAAFTDANGGTYDQVAVENSSFTVGSDGNGVFGGSSTVAGAKVVVTNCSFTGGDAGVLSTGVFASGDVDAVGNPILATAPHVDVLNSTFHGFTFSSIQYQAGVSGRISGNTLSACGFNGCIRSRINNQIEISGNSMTVEANRIIGNSHVRWGIVADGVPGGSQLIVGNTVTGVGGGGDPSLPASYAIARAGIGVGRVNPLDPRAMVGNATVSRNIILNADTGLSAHDAMVIGTDNVITGTLVGIAGVNGTTPTSLSLTRSDVTSYLVPLAGDGLVNLTCNWWGLATGPLNVTTSIATTVYTPWAVAPVANGAGGGCTGVPSAVPVQLACSLEPTVRSIDGAVSTSLQFVNQTAGAVSVYWLNYQGQRVLYNGALAAGQSYVQQTFVTHPWIVTDASGACLGIWLPTASQGVAVIG